jgi:TPR repeat protein
MRENVDNSVSNKSASEQNIMDPEWVYFLWSGIEVKTEGEEFIKRHLDATLKGSTESRYWLSLLIRYGGGVPDGMPELRVPWIAPNGRQDYNPYVSTNMGKELADFLVKVLSRVSKLAEKGHNGARCVYGLFLRAGLGCTKDLQKAYQCFHDGALAGDAGCMNCLGTLYEKGVYVPQDTRQAVTWYSRAAELGDSSGQTNLARMYLNGWGIDFNAELVLKWYRSAVKNGSIVAQVQLLKLYESGRCLPPGECLPALRWLADAANHDPTARYLLGTYYEKGIGVRANIGRAFELYRSAAEEGNLLAMTILSKMYTFGWGTPKDDQLALKWCRTPANLGEPQAVGHLAYLCMFGIGCVRDLNLACRLYDRYAYYAKIHLIDFGRKQIAINLFKNGNYRKAFDILSKLVNEHKKPVTTVGIRRYESEPIHCGMDEEWNREYTQAVKHLMNGNLLFAWATGRKSLEIAEGLYGPDHVDFAASINLLGEVIQAMGHVSVAVVIFRRALALRVRKLGGAHYEVADTLQLMYAYENDIYFGDIYNLKHEDLMSSDQKPMDLVYKICSSEGQPLAAAYILLRFAHVHCATDLATDAIKLAITRFSKELGKNHSITQEAKKVAGYVKRELADFEKFHRETERAARRSGR